MGIRRESWLGWMPSDAGLGLSVISAIRCAFPDRSLPGSTCPSAYAGFIQEEKFTDNSLLIRCLIRLSPDLRGFMHEEKFTDKFAVKFAVNSLLSSGSAN